MFLDMQKYAHSESVFNTLYIEIKHRCWKTSFGQNKQYKNPPPHPSSFSGALLLIRDFSFSIPFRFY